MPVSWVFKQGRRGTMGPSESTMPPKAAGEHRRFLLARRMLRRSSMNQAWKAAPCFSWIVCFTYGRKRRTPQNKHTGRRSWSSTEYIQVTHLFEWNTPVSVMGIFVSQRPQDEQAYQKRLASVPGAMWKLCFIFTYTRVDRCLVSNKCSGEVREEACVSTT